MFGMVMGSKMFEQLPTVRLLMISEPSCFFGERPWYGSPFDNVEHLRLEKFICKEIHASSA